jgi:hypothetical protein
MGRTTGQKVDLGPPQDRFNVFISTVKTRQDLGYSFAINYSERYFIYLLQSVS